MHNTKTSDQAFSFYWSVRGREWEQKYLPGAGVCVRGLGGSTCASREGTLWVEWGQKTEKRDWCTGGCWESLRPGQNPPMGSYRTLCSQRPRRQVTMLQGWSSSSVFSPSTFPLFPCPAPNVGQWVKQHPHCYHDKNLKHSEKICNVCGGQLIYMNFPPGRGEGYYANPQGWEENYGYL
jgi:hypothetical protein